METREWGYNVDVFLAYNNPMRTKLGCAKSTFTNEALIIIIVSQREITISHPDNYVYAAIFYFA